MASDKAKLPRQATVSRLGKVKKEKIITKKGSKITEKGNEGMRMSFLVGKKSPDRCSVPGSAPLFMLILLSSS